MSKKNQSQKEVNEEIQQGFSVVDNSPEVPTTKTQVEQYEERVAQLEKELSEAKASGGDASLKERIAHLEGKLQKEKSQEELYQERRAKYHANVEKRKAKEKAREDALSKIEGDYE